MVIRDLMSLQAWRRRLRDIVSPRRLPAVEFQLPELASEQNRSFSLLAAGYQGACGCASGGLFMTVAVVTMIISYLVTGHRPTEIDLRQLLTFLGVTVLAALAGKLAGLLWARWRLWRLASAVHSVISGAMTK